jgi:hypothetical protein
VIFNTLAEIWLKATGHAAVGFRVAGNPREQATKWFAARSRNSIGPRKIQIGLAT